MNMLFLRQSFKTKLKLYLRMTYKKKFSFHIHMFPFDKYFSTFSQHSQELITNYSNLSVHPVFLQFYNITFLSQCSTYYFPLCCFLVLKRSMCRNICCPKLRMFCGLAALYCFQGVMLYQVKCFSVVCRISKACRIYVILDHLDKVSFHR